MIHDTTRVGDQGQEPGGPRVEVNHQRFRVRTAQFTTQWLPDTPSNRHLLVVCFRLLVDDQGKPLFTLQELATLIDSTNRQAASQPLEEFRPCGEDMRAFVLRQRNVDTTVVEGVLHERLQTPLAGPTELLARVQQRLARQDLSVANIESALPQISCVPVLRTLRRQFEAGQVHDEEAWLVTELLESQSTPAASGLGWHGPSADGGMRLADPTALAALVTPDLPLAEVPGSLCWLSFCMTLCSWHVPLSVLGRWCGGHKTTMLRWVVGLAVALWPLVSHWITERVRAQRGYVDEKWLKIRGRWQYWFVVLDVPTELPVLAALLPSRGQWAGRWVGAQLRQLKQVPRVLITDGLPAYAYLLPAAKHRLCRFHHQQGVTHWLKQHFATAAEIEARKPVMKRLLQTRDQRTVRRRFARLKARAAELGMMPWVTGVEAKLPQLIGTVGSRRMPATTKAIERCFRAFERFYNTRQGFHSVLSATRERLLFLVVYVFTQRASTGQAPIEVILPEARRMPLYRLINDPFRALQERRNVKPEAKMADLLLAQEAAG
jgi:transposase-like protein